MKAKYETRKVDFYYRGDKEGTVGLGCAPHLHYHVEIVYMLSGRMQAYIDSEPYKVEGGDMLVVFPNRIHRFVDEMSGNRYMLFIINPNLVPEFEKLMASSSPESPLIKNALSNKRLYSIAEILSDCRNFPEKQKDLLMKGYLLSFFSEFISMLNVSSSRNDDNQAMKALILYCSQNFTRDLSLSTLESELHLSKYYISHLFGDKLEIRFNDYINSLRISEACRLLRTTDSSMTEVADSSGFGTIRTFNRAFVKQMGISPSDYRKNNNGRCTNVSMPPDKVGVNGYITPEAQRHESDSERDLERLMQFPFLSRENVNECVDKDSSNTTPTPTPADLTCLTEDNCRCDDSCSDPKRNARDYFYTYPQRELVDGCLELSDDFDGKDY